MEVGREEEERGGEGSSQLLGDIEWKKKEMREDGGGCSGGTRMEEVEGREIGRVSREEGVDVISKTSPKSSHTKSKKREGT